MMGIIRREKTGGDFEEKKNEWATGERMLEQSREEEWEDAKQQSRDVMIRLQEAKLRLCVMLWL